MYEELISQYNNLSEEEKNSLLIYKSRLGLLINDLDNNPDFEYYYNFLLKTLNNPINAIVKITVFNTINLTNLDTFKESIINIKNILDSTISKLTINESVSVFRAVSTNNEINDISKSNIISTSLSFGETLKFATAGNNINIYQINLKEGSKCAIIPYSILYNNKTGQLIISKSSDQQEIILDKNMYDFEVIDKQDNDAASIIEINATLKTNKKAK